MLARLFCMNIQWWDFLICDTFPAWFILRLIPISAQQSTLTWCMQSQKISYQLCIAHDMWVVHGLKWRGVCSRLHVSRVKADYRCSTIRYDEDKSPGTNSPQIFLVFISVHLKKSNVICGLECLHLLQRIQIDGSNLGASWYQSARKNPTINPGDTETEIILSLCVTWQAKAGINDIRQVKRGQGWSYLKGFEVKRMECTIFSDAAIVS